MKCNFIGRVYIMLLLLTILFVLASCTRNNIDIQQQDSMPSGQDDNAAFVEREQENHQNFVDTSIVDAPMTIANIPNRNDYMTADDIMYQKEVVGTFLGEFIDLQKEIILTPNAISEDMNVLFLDTAALKYEYDFGYIYFTPVPYLDDRVKDGEIIVAMIVIDTDSLIGPRETKIGDHYEDVLKKYPSGLDQEDNGYLYYYDSQTMPQYYAYGRVNSIEEQDLMIIRYEYQMPEDMLSNAEGYLDSYTNIYVSYKILDEIVVEIAMGVVNLVN